MSSVLLKNFGNPLGNFRRLLEWDRRQWVKKRSVVSMLFLVIMRKIRDNWFKKEIGMETID